METRTVTVVDQEFDETQAYKDLVKAFTPAIPEGAFTTQQFAEDAGMAPTTADSKLRGLAEEGVLKTKLARLDGHQRRIYWFAEEHDGTEQS